MKSTRRWVITRDRASSAEKDGLISFLQTSRETPGVQKKTCFYSRNRD